MDHQIIPHLIKNFDIARIYFLDVSFNFLFNFFHSLLKLFKFFSHIDLRFPISLLTSMRVNLFIYLR